MTNYWQVDRINSYLMGNLLSGTSVPTAPHPLSAGRKWQVWTEIVFISICHQANWDRLHDRIIEVASDNLLELHPSNLCRMEPGQFRKLFAPGLDSSRMRTGERIKLLQCLGEKACGWLSETGGSWLDDESITLAGKEGVYSWLNKVPVFAEDPIQKKSRILIHQLLRYGLVIVADPQNIAPAVDYHIIRLYVRTARVRPLKGELMERLKAGGTARVEFITSLRKAVEEAMYYSAAGAGVRIDELNHIEWQIARSFCVRQEALCHCGPLTEKPIDEMVLTLSCKAGGGCPYANDCQGALDAQLRGIVDPQSIKSYY